MEDLARLLQQMGIKFSAEGNWIQWAQPHSNNAGSFFKIFRCLPHIINLSMKAALKVFSTHSTFEWDNKDFSDDDNNSNDEDNGWLNMSYIKDDNDEEYIETLKTDLITAARHLLATCCTSRQCHEGFHQTIEEGNKNGTFGEKGLCMVTLLHDMDIRWSSTYLMVDHVLELYPVCCIFQFFFRFFLNIWIGNWYFYQSTWATTWRAFK